jgi:hypothetical protein
MKSTMALAWICECVVFSQCIRARLMMLTFYCPSLVSDTINKRISRQETLMYVVSKSDLAKGRDTSDGPGRIAICGAAGCGAILPAEVSLCHWLDKE